ncbi:unnamed protein product [Prunus armeniaca]|uniref:Uncharacterized protein n=1 Tax=Prunus armeniaca TaxID=36596 RepID=A0A6J5WFU9_PRUAR|nr:unnamed protein product [Prunus armeniaca]
MTEISGNFSRLEQPERVWGKKDREGGVSLLGREAVLFLYIYFFGLFLAGRVGYSRIVTAADHVSWTLRASGMTRRHQDTTSLGGPS